MQGDPAASLDAPPHPGVPLVEQPHVDVVSLTSLSGAEYSRAAPPPPASPRADSLPALHEPHSGDRQSPRLSDSSASSTGSRGGAGGGSSDSEASSSPADAADAELKRTMAALRVRVPGVTDKWRVSRLALVRRLIDRMAKLEAAVHDRTVAEERARAQRLRYGASVPVRSPLLSGSARPPSDVQCPCRDRCNETGQGLSLWYQRSEPPSGTRSGYFFG